MSFTPTDDWQMNKSVLEANKHALENQLYCDVTFAFNQENETPKKGHNFFQAHKYMLITRSPVFCAMFTGPAKDDNPEINIEDVEKETFLDMLKYIYTEQVELTGYNILAVMYCAKKYMIPELEKLCRDFLEKNIDHTNVCFILEQAGVMGENNLEEKCLTLLDGVADEALMSKAFTKINLSTVERILKRDTLGIEEMHVYKACVAWAEAECERQEIEVNDENKRKVMGGAVNLIRFPIMELDDFCKTVGVAKVLTAEEALDVVLYMKASGGRNELKFPVEPRPSTWKEQFFENASSCNHPVINGTVSQNVSISGGRLSLSSLYILDVLGILGSVVINGARNQYTSSRIDSSDKHSVDGYELREVVFDPPARLEPGNVTLTFYSTPGQLVSSTRLKGNRTLQVNNVTLSVDTDPWYFLAGFKLRRF